MSASVFVAMNEELLSMIWLPLLNDNETEESMGMR
jgi:hypothetical protein